MRTYDLTGIIDDSKTSTIMRQIFGVPYHVRIKNKYLIDEATIEEVGVIISQDPILDVVAGEREVDTIFFIADMAEFHDQGVPFEILEVSLLHWIVDRINDYIKLGVESLNDYHITREHLEENPEFIEFYKDLVKLDILASTIKPLAHTVSPINTPKSSFGGTVRRTMGRLMLTPQYSSSDVGNGLDSRSTISIYLREDLKRIFRMYTPKKLRVT